MVPELERDGGAEGEGAEGLVLEYSSSWILILIFKEQINSVHKISYLLTPLNIKRQKWLLYYCLKSVKDMDIAGFFLTKMAWSGE